MTTSDDELLIAFELQALDRIRAVLDSGFDLLIPLRGKSAINWLIEMYSRSDRFPDCVRLLLGRGAVLDDPVVAPILLDDAAMLHDMARRNPSLIHHRTTITSAFTPLVDASLLHLAAEYGHMRVARALIDLGADVNAPAAMDAHGLNGHTPIFHTVNAHDNRSAPLLRVLVDAGARTDVRVAGITWGKSFAWETTCFDVTPISYAQLGLLPQMHRRDRDIYDTITYLLQTAGRSIPPLNNVPNKYVNPKT